MKKQIEILILQIVFTICSYQSSYSQNWFEGNPSWRYYYESEIFNIIYGADELQFKKDTIIQGKLCKIFNNSSSRYDFFGWSSSSEYDIILFEEDDKIYRYNISTEEITKLYDFTLETGDTVKTIIQDDLTNPQCDDTLISVIDTILLTEIDGYSLRTQVWRNLNNNNFDQFGPVFYIYEKIGVIGNFFFDMTIDWHCFQDGSHPFEFGCYLNKDLGIEHGSDLCVELLPVLETENPHSIANIFPNPGNGIFHLQSQKNIKSIRIIDFHGKLIKITYSNNELDMINNISGIYLLQIKYEDGTFEIQKIIKK